jgi:hypothetical protein
LTTLIFNDFKPTPVYFEKLEMIEVLTSEDSLKLVFLDNKGGSALAGKIFLTTLQHCKAKTTLTIKGDAKSTAAFVWMSVFVDQYRGLYQSVMLYTEQDTTILTYHRPFKYEGVCKEYAKDIKNREHFDRIKEYVDLFDEYLILFMNKNPTLIVMANIEGMRPYPHCEIGKLYADDNDIHIILRK